MARLTVICHRTAKHLQLWLRDIAYDNMARQASDWTPDAVRAARQGHNHGPVEIAFQVQKKHRLAWLCRLMHHKSS